MTYTLDVTEDDLKRIAQAKRAGINVDGFLKNAIGILPQPTTRSEPRPRPQPVDLPMPQPRLTQPHPVRPMTDEERQASIAYFAEEARKAASATPEELAEGERDLQELLDALRRNDADADEGQTNGA